MKAESIIKPKRPKGCDWHLIPAPPNWHNYGYAAEFWEHVSGIHCISAVEVARNSDEPDKGPEYHLSISGPNRSRVARRDARWILRQFDMQGAEEDNHVPGGFVRNFWRPVADRLIGLECACKDQEPVMREDKGDFEWRGISK